MKQDALHPILTTSLKIVQFQAQKPYVVQRRGAEFALSTIAKHFGAEMAKGLPHLWDAMVGSLRNNIHINNFGNYTSILSWGTSRMGIAC